MTGIDGVSSPLVHGDANSMALWYAALGIFLTILAALVLLYRLTARKAEEEAIDTFLEEHEVFR